jgi:hypothetical protein
LAKKSSRTPTGLNLTPELPEVASRDFNLFYTPQKEPEIAGLKEFTSSLDNFVNGGGTKAVLASEAEDKKINSAQAQQDYAQNKLAFKEAIKAGQIDATANPYYLEKYKELTLNSFASEFSSKLNKAYQDQKIVEDIRPNSFDNFYKDQLGKFIKERELGAFNPLDLEKGFFKETSGFRNQFENNHRTAQLTVFKEKFNDRVKARIGVVIDQFKNYEDSAFAESGSGYNKYNLMADSINALIAELIDVNGDGRETIDVVLDGIKNWATTTSDYELAKKIVNELPAKLLAGTNSIENIGRVKLEKDKLFDALVEKSAERTSKYNQLTKGRREQEQLNTYSFLAEKVKENPDFDVTAWLNDPKRTGSEKQGATDFIKDLQFDRGNTDNIEVLRKIDRLNDEGKYAEAYEYTREQYRLGNLRNDTKNKYISEYIADAQSGKYDEVLQNSFVRGDLARISKIISSEKGGGSALDASDFTTYVTRKLRTWYKDNRANYKTQSDLDDAIEKKYMELVKNYRSVRENDTLFGKIDETTRGGQGNIIQNIDNAIEQKKQQEELAKQKIKEENKNLKDDEIQKLYDLKQKEKRKFKSPAEAKKAQEAKDERKALEVMKNPLTGLIRDAFDPNFNKDKK